MPVELGAVMLDAAAPTDPLDDVTGSARDAEAAGLDSVWFGDHLMLGGAPLLDCTLAAAAAAAVTERIQVGLGIFSPSLRPLVWAAKQVATLSLLAGPGRLHLGVGAGAGPDEEYRAAGSDRRSRGRQTDAFLAALPGLLASQPVAVGARDPVQVTLHPTAPPPDRLGGRGLRAGPPAGGHVR